MRKLPTIFQNFSRLPGFTVPGLALPALAIALIIAGCSGNDLETEAKYPTGADRSQVKDDIYAEPKSIFGQDGLALLKDKSSREDGAGVTGGLTGGGIGVNGYLWRATLDTVSFMPIANVDPFGGVIITDWHTPPETKGERYKINAFILDRQLKANGIRIKAFKQVKRNGQWENADTANDMATKLEDAVLTRARQLRVADKN